MICIFSISDVVLFFLLPASVLRWWQAEIKPQMKPNRSEQHSESFLTELLLTDRGSAFRKRASSTDLKVSPVCSTEKPDSRSPALIWFPEYGHGAYASVGHIPEMLGSMNIKLAANNRVAHG